EPSRSVELRHEGVFEAAEGGLYGIRGRGAGRGGNSRNISVAARIYSEVVANIVATAAEVGGVDEPSRSVELRHEGVCAAAEGGLHGIRGREVGRVGSSRNISVAARIYSEAVAIIDATAAEVGGVDEPSRSVELRHEDIRAAAEGGLYGI